MKRTTLAVSLMLALALPSLANAAKDEIPLAVANNPHAMGEEIPVIPAQDMEDAKAKARAMRPDRRASTQPTQHNANSTVKSQQSQKQDRTQTTALPANVAASSSINRDPNVMVQPGENVVISIARNQPNRLMTPFKHPVLVTSDLSGGKGGECGEVCARGSVIYVTTDQQKPVTVFISESGREDIAISLTMVPERIAPRQVQLQLPSDVMDTLRIGTDRTGIVGDAQDAKRWERSQPYVDMIRTSFRQVALGEVPQGFSLRRTKTNDKLPFCRQSGLTFDFKNGQVMEGHDMTIFVGTVQNKANDPIEINEMRCGNWNVAAVASYPLKVLRAGQKTEIYVAVKREIKPSSATVRKPLIQRQYR